MHRFYLPPDDCRGASLLLTGREAHHGLHVLRLRRGEQVCVLNGAGKELVCEVLNCERDTIRLAVIKQNPIPPLPFQITLLQAVPKGKILESIIQKAVELGASRIVPLLSERVTIRLNGESAMQKAEKWQWTAIEAAKQSGSAWLPKVEAPVTPEEFLAHQEKFDLPLIASLQPGSRHAREYFDTFRNQLGRLPGSICIWVGPEGDFTMDEIAAIEAGGALPITLGRLVLRSETAAVYCLSILNHELLSPPPGRD